MKKIPLITIIFLIGSFGKLYSQDTTRHDQSLRLTLTLLDSIGIEHYFTRDSTVKTIYKFRIDSLYKGVYNYPFIYVAAREEIMHHFNTMLNTGFIYWWGIFDTGEWYNGFPIYRHTSSW